MPNMDIEEVMGGNQILDEKILVVDDEKGILEVLLEVLSYALKREGYIIEKAYNGQEAIDKVKSLPLIENKEL
jgi:CheY-like chemotaxis protein